MNSYLYIVLMPPNYNFILLYIKFSQVECKVNLEFLFAQMEIFLTKHTDHKAQAWTVKLCK